MSAAHTPGPWTAHFDHPQNACAYVRASSGYNEIASMFVAPGDGDSKRDGNGCWADQPVRDANARLIAAAPELLAVAAAVANIGEYRELVERMSLCLHPRERESFECLFREDARAAVAKATGSDK